MTLNTINGVERSLWAARECEGGNLAITPGWAYIPGQLEGPGPGGVGAVGPATQKKGLRSKRKRAPGRGDCQVSVATYPPIHGTIPVNI